MSVLQKNSGKGYNICKKFQIGSVILMTQMTNQKKTELIHFFDLVWTKNPQCFKNFLKMKAIFPPNSPQIVFWRPPLGTKFPKMVQLFRKKIPERVDIETLYWHTPVRKYHEFPSPGLVPSSVIRW